VLLAIGYQPKDEKLWVRVINYPARELEIQQSKNLRLLPITKRSIWEVMQNIDKIDLKLNSGTKQKCKIL
jgi:DNA helicase-2/ATP-dependent DNA helicase PcrA